MNFQVLKNHGRSRNWIVTSMRKKLNFNYLKNVRIIGTNN